MLRKLLAGAALVAAVPAPAAQPEVPAPREEPDPAAIAAARGLLEATDFNRQLEHSARLTGQTTFATALATLQRQHSTDFPDALELELHRIVDEHIEESIAILLPTALDDTARIYARYFTAAELVELQRLQTHPVMVRFQQIAPQFVAELAQIGVPADVERMPELLRRLGEAVAAWTAEQARHGEAPAT
jgi:hypothetical protein